MTKADLSPAAAALASLLRHGPGLPAQTIQAIDVPLVDLAVEHGVAPLLYRALTGMGLVDLLDQEAGRRLGRIAREAILIESARSDDLAELTRILAELGIRPLLFKGAALASRYPAPALRSRGDSDLLVRPEDVEATCRALERRGFQRTPRPRGTQVTQQARYVGSRASIEIAYDVHWRLADPHAFAGVLSFDELQREADTDPATGALRLGPVHALLVACIHRAAHHYDTDNLILLYDIDLLARGLTSDEWERFVGLSEARQLRAVCGRGLGLAAQAFETPVPAEVAARLAVAAEREPTAVYVAGSLRRIDVLRSDLGQLPTWRARAQLLREHLFPAGEYVLPAGREAGRGVSLLAAYARRISRGARKWFRPLA